MSRTRRASLIRFQTVLLSVGLVTALDKPAGAQDETSAKAPPTKSVEHVAARENPTTTSVATKADARTSETAQRWGTKAAFVGQGLVVSSCKAPCKTSQAELTLTVPQELLSAPRTVKVLSLKGGEQALWVRYGSEEQHYSLIILGGVRTKDGATPETMAPPELVFRGLSTPTGARLSFHETKEGSSIYVTSGATTSLCGRNIPINTQRLEATSGKFLPVKLSPLGASERNSAEIVHPTAVALTDTDLLLQLNSDTESAPTDGQRDQIWNTAYGSIALRFDETSQEDLVFEFKEPLSETVTLQLASESKAWTLQFEPSQGATYILPRPPETPCLALIQPIRPPGLVEVMGRVKIEPPATVAGLVAKLETTEATRSQRALALLGAPALSALLTAYPRLSPQGQMRAFAIGERAPFGAPLLVLSLDTGPESLLERAQAALLARPTTGRDALLARLGSSRVESPERLTRVLFQIDPDAGATAILQGLGSKNPAWRASYQNAFRSLFADPLTRRHFEILLFQQGQFTQLNRHAQIAILRSLSDSYDITAVESATLELARSANFQDAYLLVPVLAARRAKLNGSTEILRSWLGSALPPRTEPTERAALIVQILEQLRAPGHAPLDDAFGAAVTPLLSSKNMRVRAASAQFFAEFPNPSAAVPLDHALRKDPWPEVRSAAAAGLGKLLEPASSVRLPAKERENWEQTLTARVKRERETTVRRALLKALSRLDTETALKAVRKSFAKDDALEVRAEAALALGKMCDYVSLNDLTRVARALGDGHVDEGAVTLSLNAVSALAQLAPDDLKTRIAPSLAPHVPGPLRARVSAQLMAKGETCRSSSPQK